MEAGAMVMIVRFADGDRSRETFQAGYLGAFPRLARCE